MAFAFRENGERKKLAEHISSLKENGADGKPIADQSLIESAKSAALAQLSALSDTFNGALVICEGQSNENMRSITVQVFGQKLHV